MRESYHITDPRIREAVRMSLQDDDLSVFDDEPLGLGADGDVHSDPYCATIAPLGSPEARHGEVCERCAQRQAAAPEGA